MRNLLPALACGLAGCAIAVILVLTGVVTPPASEAPRGARGSNDAIPNEPTKFDDTGLQNLRSELRILRSDLDTANAELRKLREARGEVIPSKQPPSAETRPQTDIIAQSNEELLWMRLVVRSWRPLMYSNAAGLMRDTVKKLNLIYRDKGTIQGTTLESLKVAPVEVELMYDRFWTFGDFALTLISASRGELELVGDPATPRLKVFFDFEASPVMSWNRAVPGVPQNRVVGSASDADSRESGAEARASEARATAGAMKDRARVVYQRTNKAPMSIRDLGFGETEMEGDYLTSRDYTISGTAEEWVVTVRNVFRDAPYDLVMTANLIEGKASFNR